MLQDFGQATAVRVKRHHPALADTKQRRAMSAAMFMPPAKAPNG